MSSVSKAFSTPPRSAVRVCALLGASLLADVCRVLELSHSRPRSDDVASARSSVEVIWQQVSSLKDLRKSRSDGVSRLVVDPGQLAILHPAASRRDVILALGQWTGSRVILIARPQADLLHPLHAIASAVHSSLFVVGVDDAETLREGLGFDEPDYQMSAAIALKMAAAWPASLRETLVAALEAPVQWPVKKMASAAGMSKRTVERYFERAGLPGPGEFLRRAAAVGGEQAPSE